MASTYYTVTARFLLGSGKRRSRTQLGEFLSMKEALDFIQGRVTPLSVGESLEIEVIER